MGHTPHWMLVCFSCRTGQALLETPISRPSFGLQEKTYITGEDMQTSPMWRRSRIQIPISSSAWEPYYLLHHPWYLHGKQCTSYSLQTHAGKWLHLLHFTPSLISFRLTQTQHSPPPFPKDEKPVVWDCRGKTGKLRVKLRWAFLVCLPFQRSGC